MWALAGAIVQLPGTAVWLSAHGFQHAANQSPAICDLVVRYNDLLFSQVQQSVACNALHSLEARLCRWLLQAHDCVDGDIIPLTQEFLGQMIGVRRTTVTIAARLLQSAGAIHYRRGVIQIIDRPALEGIACECYAMLRHNIYRFSLHALSDKKTGARASRCKQFFNPPQKPRLLLASRPAHCGEAARFRVRAVI
jgi:hypothetical protein